MEAEKHSLPELKVQLKQMIDELYELEPPTRLEWRVKAIKQKVIEFGDYTDVSNCLDEIEQTVDNDVQFALDAEQDYLKDKNEDTKEDFEEHLEAAINQLRMDVEDLLK